MCRGEGFYRPGNSVAALGNVAALLQLAALAFYPLRLGWGTCDPPGGGDPDGILSFAQDASANPFRAFCKTGLAPKLETPGLRLLLFWISSEAQLPATATMAVFSKKRNPDLHVAVAGVAELLAGSKRFADSLLTVPDNQLLPRLKQLTGGSDTDRIEAGPDFSCLPHGPYLAPAPVLSFDLRPGGIQPDPPMGLFEFIKRCQEKFAARGVFITVDEDLHRYFPGPDGTVDGNGTALCLGIYTKLGEICQKIDGKALHRAGVRLIVWRAPEGSLEALKAVLWQMSQAGIWNHLQVANRGDDALIDALILFAAANPNIVHSWDDTRFPAAPADHSPGPDEPTVYRRVRKLPGRPLWQILNDPVHLLLYLERHGRQKVMRWRVPDNPAGVYTLGSQLDYHYTPPGKLPPGFMDEICLMVADGGSVDMERVRDNLEKAFLIAYAMEEGVIVGNSSLKNPRPEYIKTVNRQSGLDLTHYVERGYTSVRPEYRGMGIGARLLAGLTKRAGDHKVFSVISEDNAAARKMAIRNRTRQVAEYYSPRLGKKVGVWIPEWMLD
jgi:GNAT superfamily N-acetyltransferase